MPQMRLMPFLPLMPALPMIAAINLYGFIIVLVMLTPAWLWAMSAAVLSIRRSWRAERQQREIVGRRLRVSRGLVVIAATAPVFWLVIVERL
jgi:hypothetical protein